MSNRWHAFRNLVRWLGDCVFKRRRIFVWRTDTSTGAGDSIGEGIVSIRGRREYERAVGEHPRIVALLHAAIDDRQLQLRVDSDRATWLVKLDDGGEPVACVCWLAAYGLPFWHDAVRIEAREAMAVTLYVAPRARSCGLGRQMNIALRRAAEADAGIDRLFAIVECRNRPSMASLAKMPTDRVLRNYLVKWRGRNIASIVIGRRTLRVWRIGARRRRSGFPPVAPEAVGGAQSGGSAATNSAD